MFRKIFIAAFVLVLVSSVCMASEKPDGCSPKFQAIGENAVVELKGTGEQDIVIVTDPFCWHCRLAHKLLGEYPEQYRSVKFSFYMRRNSPGSDMASWIIEDAAGTDSLKSKIDFAYKHLKQPKTNDPAVAREVVFSQFVMFFPDLLGLDSIENAMAQLQKKHEAHVLTSTALAKAAGIPGTPVLLAGEKRLSDTVRTHGWKHWKQRLSANRQIKS